METSPLEGGQGGKTLVVKINLPLFQNFPYIFAPYKKFK
jgi:hypothetical protein